MSCLSLELSNQTYRIYYPEAGQRSRHLEQTECIRFILIEIPESAFKLLKLCWCKVGHIAGHDLPVSSQASPMRSL
jgi:hypothetical protein